MADKLNFKDPAESTLVNTKFLGRLGDDETVGKLDLSNVDPTSGDAIINIQRQLNENKLKVMVAQSVTAGGILLSDNISKMQIKNVTGTPGAVTASSTPFGSAPDIQDGTIFYIIGQSDSNPVTIEYNDSDDGCLLNGDAMLLRGYTLQLLWDATAKRFYDIGRNF
jgi:hypothetical protein